MARNDALARLIQDYVMMKAAGYDIPDNVERIVLKAIGDVVLRRRGNQEVRREEVAPASNLTPKQVEQEARGRARGKQVDYEKEAMPMANIKPSIITKQTIAPRQYKVTEMVQQPDGVRVNKKTGERTQLSGGKLPVGRDVTEHRSIQLGHISNTKSGKKIPFAWLATKTGEEGWKAANHGLTTPEGHKLWEEHTKNWSIEDHAQAMDTHLVAALRLNAAGMEQLETKGGNIVGERKHLTQMEQPGVKARAHHGHALKHLEAIKKIMATEERKHYDAINEHNLSPEVRSGQVAAKVYHPFSEE
jgi:hypothetical protein